MGQILIYGGMLLAVTISQAADPPVFHWQRSVELPELTATTLVSVELDEHFHAKTRSNWPDFRLRDEQGHNIGCLLDTVKDPSAKTIEKSWTVTKLTAKVSPETGLQVTFQLDEKDPQPEKFRIVTPLRDFEHQVQVETSADGTTWVPAGQPALIFDYAKHIDARNVDVPVQTGDHRHFRLKIADVTAEQESQLVEFTRRLRGGQELDRTERSAQQRRPFRVDQLQLIGRVADPAHQEVRTRHYPATDFAVSQNEKEKQTVVTFFVDQQPIRQVRVAVNDENFHRHVRLEWDYVDDDGRHSWQGTIHETIRRFHVGNLRSEHLTISAPAGATFGALSQSGKRAVKYRLVIENGDSPPLTIASVEPWGPIYALTFLASPGQKLELAYDSPEMAAGNLDTAAVQAALNQGLPAVQGTLNVPKENLGAVAAVPAWKPWNDPRVLFGGIIALTLLLAWGLFHASRRVNLPPEGP